MEQEKTDEAKTAVRMSELFAILGAYGDNPFGKAEEDYHALLGRLSIRPYRALGDKAAAVLQTLNAITADNALDFVIDIACAEFAYGLLPYIANLEDDVSGKPMKLADGKEGIATLIDPALYDVADHCGFTDYLKSQGCEADYLEYCRLVDRALDFRDIMRIEKLAQDINPEEMEKTIKAVREFKGILSSEDIKNLASIVSGADAAWQGTKAVVADKAAAAAMEQAVVGSRPESERKAGAEAVAQYEAAKKAEKASKTSDQDDPKAQKA